jgi:hypothetical protein
MIMLTEQEKLKREAARLLAALKLAVDRLEMDPPQISAPMLGYLQMRVRKAEAMGIGREK